VNLLICIVRPDGRRLFSEFDSSCRLSTMVQPNSVVDKVSSSFYNWAEDATKLPL
jgi:hypothetical protein